MNETVRFPYGQSKRPQASGLAYLPITLRTSAASREITALLDSGSTVNILPYQLGLECGFTWSEQTTPVTLTGSLGRLPAKGVILAVQIPSFLPVDLVFAWTRSDNVPVILGQVNFFAEFDICFFHSRQVFEVRPKPSESSPP